MGKGIISTGIVLALMFATNMARGADAEDAKAAVKKLADSPNYTWTTKASGGGMPGAQPADFKTEKSGYTTIKHNLSMMLGGTSVDIIFKGDKGVAQMAGKWMSQADLITNSGDGATLGPEIDVIIAMSNFSAPATQAAKLMETATNVQKNGDTYTADLAPAAIKEMLASKLPAGFHPKAVSEVISKNEKGTIKLTLKAGVVTEIEVHVTTTQVASGHEFPLDQTTTMVIKDVGTTKVTVPDAAKKKLDEAATAPKP